VVISNTTLATLMATLDVNIVIIAIPSIGRQLRGASLFDLLWVLLGYQIVLASLLVNFGRLADMFGRVKLYNLGFIIFTIGSALCSLSQTGSELVIFRMIQGVGGAFLISNSAAIIIDAFPVNERGKALGINRVSQVAGAAGGLVLGGFLTTVGGWQAIFWVNVPIGIFGTLWSHYKLKELGSLEKNPKIDVPGNIMFAAAFASLLIGVSLYALGSLTAIYLALLCGASALLFGLFVIVELRVENPMLDLSLFKIRPFSGGSSATFLNSLARGCVLLVLTFYLQGPTMNLSPLLAGLFLFPNSLSISVIGPIGGWLSDRGLTRFYTTLGLLISAVGFLVLAQIGTTVSFIGLALPLVLIGVGQGFFASPNRASVLTSVPPVRRGVASSVNSTMVQVGNSFSRAFSFLIMGLVLPGAVLESIFFGHSSLASNQIVISEFVSSLRLLFYICAGFVFLSIFPSIMRGPTKSYSEEVLEET
jgi:EmrB/QacA subfamily drug resistance transporter